MVKKNVSRAQSVQNSNGRLSTSVDPSDDEFRVAFQQYGREKNGSGLSAAEQLARLSAEFPQLDIKLAVHLQ